MQPATLKATLYFALAVAFAIACAYASPDLVLNPTPAHAADLALEYSEAG